MSSDFCGFGYASRCTLDGCIVKRMSACRCSYQSDCKNIIGVVPQQSRGKTEKTGTYRKKKWRYIRVDTVQGSLNSWKDQVERLLRQLFLHKLATVNGIKFSIRSFYEYF